MYLEYYPKIYFSISDRLTYQDIANFQLMMAIDQSASVANQVLFNFGVDNQLQVLFNGLRQNCLAKQEFSQFKKFDSEKLRTELVFFLRLIVQLCITEVPFLRQMFTKKKDEKVDSVQEPVREMWRHAMQKEAVHLLMLNKVNANIGALKESSNEYLAKDPVFEEALFEVST